MDDSRYLDSISSAMLDKNPRTGKMLLYTIFTLVFAFFVWAYDAQIDQLVRGESKVIPYGQNQIVQNYEGGIVTEILAKEGDLVKAGDTLIKLQNVQSSSSYEKNVLEIDELKAKKLRLYAEANDKKFKYNSKDSMQVKEYNLYKSNMRQLNSKLAVLQDQITQKQKESREINSRIKHLRQSFNLILKEQKVMEPLVKEGVVSKVEYLKLLREANSIKEELESTKLTLNVTNSAVNEIKNRQKEARVDFQNEAYKKYTEVVEKIGQYSTKNRGLEDQVSRTIVKAPVTGYIKKIYVNTIGGSVKPGMDLVEIVPKDKDLILEVKIKPEDIALVFVGQKATLKFTAFDYAIYGSLSGEITNISPDSTTDKNNNTYYLAYIKAYKNFIGKKNQNIQPGMRGTADIIAGKNTVLNYILKPIIKTKQYALTEK